MFPRSAVAGFFFVYQNIWENLSKLIMDVKLQRIHLAVMLLSRIKLVQFEQVHFVFEVK